MTYRFARWSALRLSMKVMNDCPFAPSGQLSTFAAPLELFSSLDAVPS
jgi:hypothetical protein